MLTGADFTTSIRSEEHSLLLYNLRRVGLMYSSGNCSQSCKASHPAVSAHLPLGCRLLGPVRTDDDWLRPNPDGLAGASSEQ